MGCHGQPAQCTFCCKKYLPLMSKPAPPVPAAPRHEISTNLLKNLRESDGFKMLTLSTTLTTQFLAHRLVTPKIILTKRPSRMEFPFPPVLLQEQVPGMIHWNKPMELCTHPIPRQAKEEICWNPWASLPKESKEIQTHLTMTLARLPYASKAAWMPHRVTGPS